MIYTNICMCSPVILYTGMQLYANTVTNLQCDFPRKISQDLYRSQDIQELILHSTPLYMYFIPPVDMLNKMGHLYGPKKIVKIFGFVILQFYPPPPGGSACWWSGGVCCAPPK